ncbi:MAG: septum formation protein Maf [Ferruginibacter sp.]|nr:septum formation protein Maf [Ferruginibacter sp.]
MQKIILASQSPRRKQLLQWAEVDFDIIVSDSDESYPEGLSFEETAIYIARNKAIAVSKISGQALPVLAADTIVVCNGTILGKPKDRNDAIQILKQLSGTSHQVITGVVIHFQKKEIAFADITTVEFHELTGAQIIFYIDKYKPYDKAGAYAIQEWIGVVGIKSINGDFYNVMGLPVSRVLQELGQLGTNN